MDARSGGRVAALRELANQQLKQRLRGEASGVYRLRFDSELNPDTQRISQLSFTCDPQRADELWALAQQTLAQLGRSVDAKWVADERMELRRQERKRLLDPTTQWRRLLLSERQWQDPRYLSRQTRLPDGLRLELLKPLASQLFPANNQVLRAFLPGWMPLEEPAYVLPPGRAVLAPGLAVAGLADAGQHHRHGPVDRTDQCLD